MINYGISLIAAAQELASKPETMNMPSLQNAICRKYGIFLDSMTEDEIKEFERIINEYL